MQKGMDDDNHAYFFFTELYLLYKIYIFCTIVKIKLYNFNLYLYIYFF